MTHLHLHPTDRLALADLALPHLIGVQRLVALERVVPHVGPGESLFDALCDYRKALRTAAL